MNQLAGREHPMDFNPINDDHAIQLVSFKVACDRIIEPLDLQAIAQSHGRVRSELPAISGSEQPMPTLELAYLRPDGTASWLLRCGGNEITVECRRYTRWVKIWRTAQKLLLFAMNEVGASGQIKFGQPSLQFTDRFKGVKGEESDLGGLLCRSDVLAGIAFRKGPLFHSNIGYFEGARGTLILHHVNVQGRKDAFLQLPSGAQEEGYYVVLDHTQYVRGPSDFLTAADSEGYLGQVMPVMHENNKNMLLDVLVPAMTARIGLQRVAEDVK